MLHPGQSNVTPGQIPPICLMLWYSGMKGTFVTNYIMLEVTKVPWFSKIAA